MNWGWILGAGLAAAVATSFTDWFFFGVWMHGRYNTYPEVWRPADSSGKHTSAIMIGAGTSAIACFGLVALMAWLGVTAWRPALMLAGGIWLFVPVPYLIVNTMFMRLDPWLLLPHSLGYLARLLGCAVAVAWLVG